MVLIIKIALIMQFVGICLLDLNPVTHTLRLSSEMKKRRALSVEQDFRQGRDTQTSQSEVQVSTFSIHQDSSKKHLSHKEHLFSQVGPVTSAWPSFEMLSHLRLNIICRAVKHFLLGLL